MAKPSGACCNLKCKYCFYLEKEKLYSTQRTNHFMTDSTLELFIQQHIEAQSGTDVCFDWQGGEPTLLGIGFYEKVVDLCKKYSLKKNITHTFQTNGMLLNQQWCDFFKKNNFLIGLSIDGPQKFNDLYRTTRSGKGSFNKIMTAIKLLHDNQISFNTLTVINNENVKYPLEIYNFLKKIGSDFIQFIPLVEQYSSMNNIGDYTLSMPGQLTDNVTSWSVTPAEFGLFLNSIFDQWLKFDVGRVFIQIFDSTLASWLGYPAGLCVFNKECGHAFALESNGDLYQCDHYVYPQFKLGNIHNNSIKKMNASPSVHDFSKLKSNLPLKCKNCQYHFACNGDCPKHRFCTSNEGELSHSYLCTGYLNYFRHTESAMRLMANLVIHNHPAADIMKMNQALSMRG